MFRVVSVCLGSPPETICWEYRDKDKNFHRVGPLTPLEFYTKHVKPLYNLQDKVHVTSFCWLSSHSAFLSVRLLHFLTRVLFLCRFVWLMIHGHRMRMGSCIAWSFWVTWWAPAGRCTTTSPSTCWRKLLQIPLRVERWIHAFVAQT